MTFPAHYIDDGGGAGIAVATGFSYPSRFANFMKVSSGGEWFPAAGFLNGGRRARQRGESRTRRIYR